MQTDRLFVATSKLLLIAKYGAMYVHRDMDITADVKRDTIT